MTDNDSDSKSFGDIPFGGLVFLVSAPSKFASEGFKILSAPLQNFPISPVPVGQKRGGGVQKKKELECTMIRGSSVLSP